MQIAAIGTNRYMKYRCQIFAVSNDKAAIATAKVTIETNNSFLGPCRSTSEPANGDSNATDRLMIVKAAEISPRPQPNSCDRGTTKRPKDEYAALPNPNASPIQHVARTPQALALGADVDDAEVGSVVTWRLSKLLQLGREPLGLNATDLPEMIVIRIKAHVGNAAN